jgi:plastocyanin
MKEMKFDPATLEIKVGDTVVWTNSDDRDHTVNGPDGTFKSDNLKPGAAYTYKFTKAGRFAYSCSYHPRMKGTITVKEDEPPKGAS